MGGWGSGRKAQKGLVERCKVIDVGQILNSRSLCECLEQARTLYIGGNTIGYLIDNRLFEKTMLAPVPQLWEHAESFLYYQYHNSYERVRPLLDRMIDESPEVAGSAWGRLSTLCCISARFSLEELWAKSKNANETVLKGMLEVFAANFDNPISREGAMHLLSTDRVSADQLSIMERLFSECQTIDDNFAMAFLQAYLKTESTNGLWNFVVWIEKRVEREPSSAIEFMELIATIAEKREPGHYFEPLPIISALNEILREADERDEPELIHQAVALQDRFLVLNFSGMEKLFELAGRS